MNAAIRLASRADAGQIATIYAPIVRDTHISFEEAPPDASQIAQRIDACLRQYPWLVCEIDGRIAAYAYASAFRSRAAYQWTAETTVYVHKAHQRRGLARGSYRSLLALLREQGYRNAVGVIALPNAASVRAHESLGFRQVGVFHKAGFKAGAWRDTGWWQLELRSVSTTPTPPRPIHELAMRDDFESLLQTGMASMRLTKRNGDGR